MRDTIEEILAKYNTYRSTRPFKGPHEITRLFSALQSEVAQLPSVQENSNLQVKSSYGKGNWAAVPWVAILDTRETSTTQDGTYIVILFSEDGNHCQIKLAQGVTEVKASYKRQAVDELQKRADTARRQLANDDLIDLLPAKDSLELGGGKMARLYDASTIFSKEFSSGSLPDDVVFKDVINKLVAAYGQFVHEKINAPENIESVDSEPYRVWAIAAGQQGSHWDDFVRNGEIAIGWKAIGDLSQYSTLEDTLEALTTDDRKKPSNDALCCYQFAHEISVGDIVVAKIGRKKILGMGRVTSEYIWDPSSPDFQNKRKVEWIRTDSAEFPGSGTTVKTLTEITSYPTFMSLVEDYLGFDGVAEEAESYDVPHEEYTCKSIIDDGCFLSEKEILALLDRVKIKKNIILQGPPGTGKTWLARRLAYSLIGQKNPQRVKVVQFHSNISYEDFVRGYRPTSDGKLALVDGAFMEAIEDARNTSQPIVVVIEEINRGNPAQIFGEMLTLLEADKRTSDDAIELTYKRRDSERVYIPQNLYVIGTMNIADRSLALVDLALRRRFAFVDLEPTLNASWREWLQNRFDFPIALISQIESKVSALNKKICEDQRLGSQFQIGHSYVTPPEGADITDSADWFRQVVETEISPLLYEYWFDDIEEAEKVAKELARGL
jgi:MoxR-like ATPase